MEKSSAYGSSNNMLLLQTQNLHCSSQVLDSFWNPRFPPSFQGNPFSGSVSMVNFQNPPQENHRSGAYADSIDTDENNSEFYDPCSHQPEKKRRLTKDQVQLLEKSFEVENKLEPERKVQLAKVIGLQPRQVAIWYQNRRARYRTKQLEKDYDSMKESYDKLKVDYDNLLKENEILRNEVAFLKETMFVDEKRKTGLKPCDPMNSLIQEATQKQVGNPASRQVTDQRLQMMISKQEDTNSLRNIALDSDKLHSESIDSSLVLETDHSDFSQNNEDTFRRIMLPPNLVKSETESFDDLYNLESSAEDQPFLLWRDELYL